MEKIYKIKPVSNGCIVNNDTVYQGRESEQIPEVIKKDISQYYGSAEHPIGSRDEYEIKIIITKV